MEDYTGIMLSYVSILNEVYRMKKLTADFISSEGVLDACVSNLESIRNSTPNRMHRWEISDEWPLTTVPSAGEYRASQKGGGQTVYGTLTFRWEIENPDCGSGHPDNFHLIGEATISLKMFLETHDLVAQWQIEAGDASSPGCHFHSAVNQYGPDGLFPEWLKVPRLPSVLLTPMDGLEFLLGEMFQLRWAQAVSEDSEDKNSWTKSQKTRLSKLLKWKLDKIRNAETTPWMALKKAKPELGIFIT